MRWLASWILYWLGDACEKVCSATPDAWTSDGDKWPVNAADHWAHFWGSAYQRLMNWSILVQGDGDGAWYRPED